MSSSSGLLLLLLCSAPCLGFLRAPLGSSEEDYREQASGCIFTLGSGDFPSNPPSLFDVDSTGNIVLATPTLLDNKKIVSFKEGSTVLVACPGDGVQFSDSSFSSSQAQEATCVANQLSNGAKQFSLSDLGCSKRTKADIVETGESCAQGKADLLEIGFNLVSATEKIWYPLIEVCYDTNLSVTYYTKHIVDGVGLVAAEDESARPSFVTGLPNLYPNFNPNNAYLQTSQLSVLTELLGSEKLAQSMLNVTYLARGHLAPDNDFTFSGTQFATYFYVNAAPEWQSLNAGLWLALENSVRDLAKATEREYFAYTGTSGVLGVPDAKGNDVEIWLAGNQLPVPKFYWKVLVDPITRNGMGFVALNNPFSSGRVDWPCTDICKDHHWGTSTWTDRQICCEVVDMMAGLQEVPSIEVDGVLSGPRTNMPFKVRPLRGLTKLLDYFKLFNDL